MSIKLVPPEPTDGRANPPPVSPFACSWSWSNGGFASATVRVSGELDIATASRLEHTLHESWLQARRVVLDLHEVSFIDSSGVHAIVDASVRARKDQRQLVLVRVPAHVRRVFTLTDRSDQVEIGADLPGPPLETPPRPRIRGNRFKRGETHLRVVAEPASIDHETHDRLVRAIVDGGNEKDWSS